MLQIDLVLSVEEMLQSLHLRHLFPQVILDTPHSIRINKPNTLLSEWCDRLKIPKFITKFYLQWFVSDPFFMTGEELADAINQPVSSFTHPVQFLCPDYVAIYYSKPCLDRSCGLMHCKHPWVFLLYSHTVLTLDDLCAEEFNSLPPNCHNY